MSATDIRTASAAPATAGPVPADDTGPAPADQPDGRRARGGGRHGILRNPRWLAAVIASVCLLLTAASTWAAVEVDANSEHRLLQVQTRQAAAVLSTAILVIQEPLGTALSVQSVAGRMGDTTAFANLMSAYVGTGKPFESASLWQREGDRIVKLSSVGAPPVMSPGLTQTTDYLRRAFSSPTFTVRSVAAGDKSAIAYAQADSRSGFVVYAERAIPSDRRAPVDRNSAFADLDYAIYLGPKLTRSALSTTDLAASRLPLKGNTSRVAVPFGDSVLTLVTTPRHHLGASLGHRLPFIILVVGLLLTLIAARTGRTLALGRQEAEEDAATITHLYQRVGALYGQQRDLSERLQRALLPQSNPSIPNLEIASDYQAGARGVDIGGDWYSIIGLDDGRFGFVVGDVSGRGIDAVAVMARARFTIRTYLLDGQDPATTLEKCSHQFDLMADGHMTTAVVGLGDWRTGQVTLASAGHPSPLVITEDGAEFVTISPGWPLGVGPTTYESTTIQLPQGATLFCFTDGLVERRTEDIDTGLRRLARSAVAVGPSPVGDLVTRVVGSLRTDDAADDIAVLAIRWSDAR